MGCVLEGPTLQCICEPQAVHEHFLLLLVVRLFMMIVFLLIVFVSAAISQMMTWPKSDS